MPLNLWTTRLQRKTHWTITIKHSTFWILAFIGGHKKIKVWELKMLENCGLCHWQDCHVASIQILMFDIETILHLGWIKNTNIFHLNTPITIQISKAQTDLTKYAMCLTTLSRFSRFFSTEKGDFLAIKSYFFHYRFFCHILKMYKDAGNVAMAFAFIHIFRVTKEKKI